MSGGKANLPSVWGGALFLVLLLTMLNTFGVSAGVRIGGGAGAGRAITASPRPLLPSRRRNHRDNDEPREQEAGLPRSSVWVDCCVNMAK